MRGQLGKGLCVAALAGPLGLACAQKQVVELRLPRHDLIVLLRDSDTGSVGGARVSNDSGALDLAEDRQAVQVTLSAAPRTLGILSEPDLQQIFGGTLRALPPAALHFTLYFRFGTDELTDESRGRLNEILRSLQTRPAPDVVVVGHTDTVGSVETNAELGLSRAMAARAALVDAGLDPNAIDVVSGGEGDLLIETPDETPEPRNRRAEVAVR